MYHIVICDDDTLFIDHMKCLLLRAGLKPETCKFYSYLSANEFEADFQNFYTIDLLILDIQLPDVNGTVFAKSFREKFPSSTLVFCSGSSRQHQSLLSLNHTAIYSKHGQMHIW